MSEIEVVGIIFFGSLLVVAILILVRTQMPPVIIQENKIASDEIRYID